MRRMLVALALALVVAALSAAAALADGGPHGSYDKLFDGTTGMTDKCAACHRPHQAASAGFLLKKATQYELCVTCHDGSVSVLDVLDGVKLTTAVTRTAGITVTGATLNGGGFEFVNGITVTSKHNVRTSTSDPGESQPWGYLTDTGTKSGTLSQPLTCTSCHNPHGSVNYRILKESVNGYKVSVLAYYSGSFTKQEGGAGNVLTVTNKYVTDYYGGTGLTTSGGSRISETVNLAGDASKNGFALLCGSCHTSYPSAGAKFLPATGTEFGTITKYRHKTEMPYTDWKSPRKDYLLPVDCNPETGPFNPSDGTCAGSSLPKLRLASNGTDTDKIVTCLTCHRAHGTATSMTGWAVTQALGGSSPDELSPAQTATSKSMLLFTDNRAMCEACHQW